MKSKRKKERRGKKREETPLRQPIVCQMIHMRDNIQSRVEVKWIKKEKKKEKEIPAMTKAFQISKFQNFKISSR